MSEIVVLVDRDDNEIGTMEKLSAHQNACLHRAISVFIFNSRGEMLLQQRALDKYHSAGLWSNACCSHPRPGEDVQDAAYRRLQEEMGLVCQLDKSFAFIYKAEMENDLTEYEFDHVFTGVTDTLPEPNAGEVAAYKYLSRSELLNDVKQHPEKYSAWFKICLEEQLNELFN